MTTRKIGILFTVFGFILALAYDFGFYEKGLGVNFLVLLTVAVIGFSALNIVTKQPHNRWAWWLALPTLALATAPALYNNEFATYAATTLALILWLVFSMSLTIATHGLPFYLAQLPLITHLDKLVTNWTHIYHDVFSHEEGSARRVVTGLVIAFPILLIFAGLLAAADPIFADWLKNLNIWEGIWRVFRTLMITLFLGAFFYILLSDKNKLHERVVKVFKLDAVTVGVVLALVNALFALFVYIQIKYLFGGADFVFSGNITIAEYARNGFFELLRVLLLAAALIIGVHRSFAHHGSHPLINILQVLFIAQIGVVAASALHRMDLYQAAYGYTALRLYVEWFIYAVMGTLVLSGIALIAKMSFRRFFQLGLSAAIVVAAVVGLINVDSVIARENIKRFKADKGLDMYYLGSLSRDAAPQLTTLFEQSMLEKLTVSQMLTLKSVVGRYQLETVSTTVWAADWSTRQSKKTITTLPESVTKAFIEAEAKDKKYVETGNAVGITLSPFATCLDLPGEENRNFDDPNGFIPKLGCAQIGDTAAVTIQAQLIQKNQQALKPSTGERNITIYSGEQNGDLYYRIVEFNKSTNKTIVVFEQELYQGPNQIYDVDQVSNFQIQKDGSVIETNFGKREVYRYTLLFEKGQYTLAPKQNYSL